MYYKIGEFSKLARTTVKTLRYYEKEGLLRPAKIDRSLYRYYTSEQLLALARIVHLRQCGFSIDEIRRILSGGDLSELLLQRRDTLRETIAQYTSQLSRINCLLEEQNMKYEAIIKELPACIAYCKEGRLHDFGEVTDFILSSAQECLAANPNIECVKPDYCFAQYTDAEFVPHDFGFRYCQAVTQMGTPSETIRFRTLDAVKAVCVYHKGSFDTLGDAYAFAMRYLEDNRLKQAEPARECYIDGMWNRDDPADYLTEIQIPIR